MAILYGDLLNDFKRTAVIRENAQPDHSRGDSLLREAIKDGAFNPWNFDFGRMWAECFGDGEHRRCKADRTYGVTRAMEAAGPVTLSAFRLISQTVMNAMVMEQFASPELIFSRIIPTRQSNTQFEQVRGVSRMGSVVAVVNEGQKYPVVGLSETWQNYCVMQKRGFIIQFTKEVLFFDKTGDVQRAAKEGGREQAEDLELRAIDCIIDENTGAKSAALGGHRYHYENNSIATYGNSSGTHDWDNLAATNALVDWTDVENANLLFKALTDPKTGQVINVGPAKHLVCGSSLEMTAQRIRNATEIEVATPGWATTGNPTATKVANPFANKFEVLTNGFVDSRTATDTGWYYGDLTKAFALIEAWAPAMSFLGAGTQLEFEQDIVEQYKWNSLNNYTTIEPRSMVKATVA